MLSICPLVYNVVYEPPWMTKSLKHLIHRREKAFALNDLDSFKKLRNQVNRERKSCRKCFYRNKAEHLKSCSPATWLKEIKKLSVVSSPVHGGLALPEKRSDGLT